MEKRENDLLELKMYTDVIDKELTMILQSLQWDRNDLLEGVAMVTCKYDSNHRIPSDTRKEHEKLCFLKQQGYCNKEKLLSEPLDTKAKTLLKLNKEDISKIIENASKSDPLFKKVSVNCMALNNCMGCRGPEPSSLARLQATYSADERRAIHDAVVSAVPSCHDLADLALLSSNGDEQKATRSKSRVEILAELRDMRRRRAKYRVAAKTRNYSDVLRDVIKTQMEYYTEAQATTAKDKMEIERPTNSTKYSEQCRDIKTFKSDHKNDRNHRDSSEDTSNERRESLKWSSEHKREGTNEGNRDRYKETKKYDREKSVKRDDREMSGDSKIVFRSTPKYNFKSKYEGSRAKTERDRYEERSRGRKYDSREKFDERKYENNSRFRESFKDESSSNRERSKKDYKTRRYDNTTPGKREDRNKYDKYGDSRKHSDRSNSSYRDRDNGDKIYREEKYKRYYDVSEEDHYDKRKRLNK